MLGGRAGEIVSRRETPSQCRRVGSPAIRPQHCLNNVENKFYSCIKTSSGEQLQNKNEANI